MTNAPMIDPVTRTATARQRGSAEHGGANGVHFEHIAGHRVRGLQLRSDDKADER